MLRGRPPLPSQADCGAERLDGEPLHAIDLREIHTGQLLQGTAHIEGGCMALGCVPSPRAWRYGVCGEVDLGCEGRILMRALWVAGGELVIGTIVPCSRLRERTEGCWAVVPGEGVGHILCARGAMRMPLRGQRVGIVVAPHHRPEDLESRHPGDSAAHVGQLHVQQVQGVLPRLHMCRRRADQGVAMADVSPQGTQIFVGAKGPAQEPGGMERLHPWAVPHVRLPARHMLQLSGIDDMHGKPTGF